MVEENLGKENNSFLLKKMLINSLNKDNFSVKVFITLGVIIVYSLLAVIPLIGANLGEADPYGIIRIIGASKHGTSTELGILPLLTAGFVFHIFLRTNLYQFDPTHPDELKRYNRIRIFLGIVFTVIMALILILSGLYGTDLDIFTQFSIVGQLIIAGIIIIYLNEFINKGWGLGSGISIFLASGIWVQIMQAFLASNNILEGPGELTSARGIFLAILYCIGEEGLNAFGFLFFRYSPVRSHSLNLPHLSLLSVWFAIGIFLLVTFLSLQISNSNNFDDVESHKVSLSSPLLSILLTTTFFALIRFLSQVVWNSSGRENSSSIFVWILGTYQLNTAAEQYVPTGGLAYFCSPRFHILDGLFADPLTVLSHGIVYTAVFLGLYRLFSKRIPPLLNRTRTDSHNLTFDRNWLVIGLCCVFADLFNVLGIGMGIVILALILANYYQLLVNQQELEFVSFDLDKDQRVTADFLTKTPVSSRFFWIFILLLSIGLFILRFIVFVILGREV